jgi:predicted alpha/beta superfamily hydrolase
MNLSSFRHRSLSRWLSITTVTAIATAVPAAESSSTAPSPPGERGGAEAPYAIERLHSTILGEERAALIRLPRDYARDTSARYPVLFKLDGGNGLERYAAAVDTLSDAGAIPALILVAIPNARGQRNRDMTPARLHQEFEVSGKMATGEMGQGDRFLDFLEQELIPHIERRYRTAAPRILAGHSRSALLVLESLLSKPTLFDARLIFSAPLLRDEQRMIADTRAFLTTHPEHRSFIYLNWGESENGGMGQSHDAMCELLRESAPKGLRWTIARASGADHQQTPLIALPEGLLNYFSPDRTSRSVRTERETDSN